MTYAIEVLKDKLSEELIKYNHLDRMRSSSEFMNDALLDGMNDSYKRIVQIEKALEVLGRKKE